MEGVCVAGPTLYECLCDSSLIPSYQRQLRVQLFDVAQSGKQFLIQHNTLSARIKRILIAIAVCVAISRVYVVVANLLLISAVVWDQVDTHLSHRAIKKIEEDSFRLLML